MTKILPIYLTCLLISKRGDCNNDYFGDNLKTNFKPLFLNPIHLLNSLEE